MAEAAPRTREQRTRDTLARLERDVDAWVATCGPAGAPHLVPLSFWWDGAAMLLATGASRPTAVNLRANDEVRVALGGTRDVVAIEGTAETLSAAEVPPEAADAFARRAGFDPREQPPGAYVYVRVSLRSIRAWREADEQAGRLLMRDGRWLA